MSLIAAESQRQLNETFTAFVRNYLSNAMQKTQTRTRIRTRHEAARYAREHDWL